MEQQSYLTDLQFNPVLASTGQRFLNYLIDVIIFDIIIAIVKVAFLYRITTLYVDYTFTNVLLRLLISYIGFVVLYFISESAFKGRTIGKFITGTKVINEDGTEPETRTYLLRSFSRIVPFEPFSALGNPCRPWHDKWTKTFVVDVQKTEFNTASFQ